MQQPQNFAQFSKLLEFAHAGYTVFVTTTAQLPNLDENNGAFFRLECSSSGPTGTISIARKSRSSRIELLRPDHWAAIAATCLFLSGLLIIMYTCTNVGTKGTIKWREFVKPFYLLMANFESN